MYNCAVIGLGRVGSEFDDDKKRPYIASHCGAYANCKKTELVAICDIDSKKAMDCMNKCRAKWNIEITSGYTNYKDMLQKKKIDILSICTPDHYEILKEAVKYPIKAIFCEKPIAKTLKQAEEMIKLCKEKNILLMVNHYRRFDLFHQQIKDYINSDKFGKIQQASFYYTAGLFNTGTHMLDLLLFFFGEVEGVYGIENIPNNIDGFIKFKNGAFCSIQSLNVKKYSIFELCIFGEKGCIIIKDNGFDIEYLEPRNSKLYSGYKELFTVKSPIKINKKNFFVDGVKHIIDCLESKTEPLSSGTDGLKALELISKFYRSVTLKEIIYD